MSSVTTQNSFLSDTVSLDHIELSNQSETNASPVQLEGPPSCQTEIESGLPKKRVPRRVIHFSDGVIEEYSTDEEDDEDETDNTQSSVDPRTLRWLPWMLFKVLRFASASLKAADFCGEKLAWLFGITSPKYQYAINEYNRIKALEEEERIEMEKQKQVETERVSAQISQAEQGDHLDSVSMNFQS